jgi:hypothetical protein
MSETNASETLTEKRERLIKELESKLSLLKDDGAILRLEEQEKKLMAELEKVRSSIDNYRDALGLPPRAPAGTQMAAPVAKAKAKPVSNGPKRKNKTQEEKILEIIAAVKPTGGKGMTLEEVEAVTSIKKQSLYILAREAGFEIFFEKQGNKPAYYSVRSKYENATLDTIRAELTPEGAAEPKKN